MKRIPQQVPSLLINSWYLDNGTLCGFLDELAAALSIIEDEGPVRGIVLNQSKSLIVASSHHPVDHPLFSNITVSFGVFNLLGSPLNPAEYRLEAVLAKVNKVHDSIIKLRDLQDAQLEASLLHSCLSLPKLIHLLCMCPPDEITKALERSDEIMREAVSDLAGCPLSDWSWFKASLSSFMGGLNRQTTLHASVLFIGSVYQFASLIHDILEWPAEILQHLSQLICSLAKAAARSD